QFYLDIAALLQLHLRLQDFQDTCAMKTGRRSVWGVPFYCTAIFASLDIESISF
uniref:Uncharacterized protein n=1 Tax=Anopheles quadriannulatus TaxID=34691 RepID=A0A182XRB4_ANOQN